MRPASDVETRLVPALALGVVVLVVLGILFVQAASRDALERSEIRALSPAERQELSTATRRALELGCAPDGPRKARCTEQAELLLSLEECDPACRDFARTFVARPTR
jgi:hypothetical protein